MKAFINGLEVPFKDLGEPEVTFEGETYNVVLDQTGEPYIQVGTTTAYIEFRDDEGNVITTGGDEPDGEDAEQDEPDTEPTPARAEPVKAEAKPKADKPLVKDPFMLAVEHMLNERAEQDELFAVTLAKPNKSLKECCDYIYKEVRRIGREGFADEEVLGMAVHYYDEDDIKPGSVQKPLKVVVNTPIAAPKPVELSAADKEKARQLALDNAIAAEAQRLTKKKAVVKPVAPVQSQQSLF